MIDVFHLPGLREEDVAHWETRDVETTNGRITLRWPRLTPDGASHVAEHLVRAGAALRALDTDAIVDAIHTVASAWMHDPITVARSVAGVTGYSDEMATAVVAGMSRDWLRPCLTQLLTDELGDARVLDSFTRIGSRTVRAIPPALGFHIFSGNVPGVAVTSMIRGLLVKSPVFGKSAFDEPILPALFAQEVAKLEPSIGNAIAVTYWPGGTEDIERAIMQHADVIVHYGARDAIEDVKRRAPKHARILEHGPRISFGVVSRTALMREDAAARVAIDVAYAAAVFDQQGCVSPQVIFVQEGGEVTPSDFAALVSEGFNEAELIRPRGRMTGEGATAIRRLRDTAEFRAIAGSDVRILGPDDLTHTVVYDPAPGFRAGCLNRTLTIHPYKEIDEVASLIAPFRDVLQSAGVAADENSRTEIVNALVEAGVTRVASFKHLPWPPPSWHHDGRGPLTEMLRFADATA